MMEGFLNFIISNHPDAIYLRKNFIFKIIPMLNIDGVIAGNSRTWICGFFNLGNDLNRKYISPDPYYHSIIYNLK